MLLKNQIFKFSRKENQFKFTVTSWNTTKTTTKNISICVCCFYSGCKQLKEHIAMRWNFCFVYYDQDDVNCRRDFEEHKYHLLIESDYMYIRWNKLIRLKIKFICAVDVTL